MFFFGCSFDRTLDFSNCIFHSNIFFQRLEARNFSSLKDSRRILFTNVISESKFELSLNIGQKIHSIEFHNTNKNYLTYCNISISKQFCERFILKNYEVRRDIRFTPHIDDHVNNKDYAKSLPELDFENTKFLDILSFEALDFCGKSNFKGCIFQKAPLFHRSQLHPDTIFPQIASFKQRNAEAEKSYHTLYAEASRLKIREYEGMFYALSKKCNRKNILSRKNWKYIPWRRIPSVCIEWFISFCYDGVSQYGNSYIRPLLYIIFFSVVFFPSVYLYVFPSLNSWGNAIDFSLRQIIPYPLLHQKDFAIIQDINDCKTIDDSSHNELLPIYEFYLISL